MEDEAMYIPIGRHHSRTLSFCSLYSVLTFTGSNLTCLPGQRAAQGGWIWPPAKAPRPGTELPAGAAGVLHASLGPWQPQSLAVHPTAPQTPGQAGRTLQLAQPVQTNLPSVP